MGESKNTQKPITKRDRILFLKKHHTALFKAEKINFPKFIPKVNYFHKEVGEKVVGLYLKEILGRKDVYIELATKDYNIEDETRTLYKWVYNSEYKVEYQQSTAHTKSGDKQYLIPLDELVNVTKLYATKEEKVVVEEKKVPLSTQSALNFDEDPLNKILVKNMNVKELSAILWRAPISDNEVINNFINQNKPK